MIDSLLKIRETKAGLEVGIHVQPRARRSEIQGVYNEALKLRVTAPPVDDAANRAVIEYMAACLGLAKSKLHILSGARSRDKILQIVGISRQEFEKKILALISC
ncbi:MAG: DUF167 domain-containing protein [Acidobacteriota bacterium]|jgi:uncharacterized protein (TIGR00251 family)